MIFYFFLYIQQIILTLYILYKYYQLKYPLPINNIDFSD